MKILILEDEIPAFKKLRSYLFEIFESGLEYVHARSIVEGINALHEDKSFDLIFSDIRLLDGIVFEVFQQVETSIPIIFCTAYNEHLLEAFNTNGIAYVLKPYSIKEIKGAIEKYNKLFSKSSIQKAMLNELSSLFQESAQNYKRRFAIKQNAGIHLLKTEEISHILAFGDFAKLIDQRGKMHLISQNIGSLMTDLDPDQFFRLNRSQIINIDFIDKIDSYSKNRLKVRMKNEIDDFYTTSSSTKYFRAWLER